MNTIKYDNTALILKIKQSYRTLAEFCRAAGIEPKRFYKEKSAGNFRADTIIKAADALSIPPAEIGFYFFAPAIE